MKYPLSIAIAVYLLITASSFHEKNNRFDEGLRKQISTTILNNLVKQDYEAVRKDFHSSLKVTLPVEKISEAWETTVKVNGAFEKVLSTSATKMGEYNQIRIKCMFHDGNITLEVTFTEDDKVLGLFLKP